MPELSIGCTRMVVLSETVKMYWLEYYTASQPGWVPLAYVGTTICCEPNGTYKIRLFYVSETNKMVMVFELRNGVSAAGWPKFVPPGAILASIYVDTSASGKLILRIALLFVSAKYKSSLTRVRPLAN